MLELTEDTGEYDATLPMKFKVPRHYDKDEVVQAIMDAYGNLIDYVQVGHEVTRIGSGTTLVRFPTPDWLRPGAKDLPQGWYTFTPVP